MKNLFYVLLISAAFFSCKKDKKPAQDETTETTTIVTTPQQYADTIKPGSYFPVYPGSWFKYQRKDSTIFTHTVSATYLPLPVNSNTISYVPFYNGVPVRIYRFMRSPSYSNATEPISGVLPFISQTPGSTNIINISQENCNGHVASQWPYTCQENSIKNIQRNINAAGDSIIMVTVARVELHSDGGEAPLQYSYIEYTKNKGLTNFYRISNMSGHQNDTIESWRLIDYHIGLH